MNGKFLFQSVHNKINNVEGVHAIKIMRETFNGMQQSSGKSIEHHEMEGKAALQGKESWLREVYG